MIPVHQPGVGAVTDNLSTIEIWSLDDKRTAGLQESPKGARLAVLRQRGLPVPPGWVLHAANADLASTNFLIFSLAECIGLLLTELPAMKTPLTLCGWCLRSSSPNEDRDQSSGAGQAESVYGFSFSGSAAIRRNHRFCAYIERSVAKALQSGTDLYLLLQGEVKTTWNGVAFTRHPAPGMAHCMSLEFTRGHGSQFTAGRRRPSTVLLDRQDGRLLAPVNSVGGMPGNRYWIDKIASLLRTVDSLFPGDLGQDIEWGRCGNQCVIFQARPVTAAGGSHSEQFLWNGELGREFWSGAVSPFMFATVGRAIETAMLRRPLSVLPSATLWQLPLLKCSYDRIYVNTLAIRLILDHVPGWVRIPHLQAIAGLPKNWQLRPVLPFSFVHMGWRFFTARLRWLPWMPFVDLAVSRRIGYTVLNTALRSSMQITQTTGLEPWQQRLAPLLRKLEEHLGRVVWGMVYAYLLVTLGEKVIRKIVGDDLSLWEQLWGGNRKDPVFRLHQDLHSAALALRTCTAPEGAPDHPATRWLVRRYAHLTPDRDLRTRRWAEDRTLAASMIQSAAHYSAPASRGVCKATLLTSGSLMRAGKPVQALLLATLLPVVAWVRALLAWREQMRATSDLYLAALRTVMEQAQNKGEVDDNWSERSFDDATSLPAKQKNTDTQVEPPAWLQGATPVFSENSPDFSPDNTVLRGTAVYHGVIQGTAGSVAQLISGPVGSDFVLVAEYLDPSLGPLLPLCAGAIFEAGGTLSHGGILAREYRIPACTDVRGAVRRLRPGTPVAMDTWQGTITIRQES